MPSALLFVGRLRIFYYLQHMLKIVEFFSGHKIKPPAPAILDFNIFALHFTFFGCILLPLAHGSFLHIWYRED